MLVETGKKIFCLSLDTGKQSGTFRPLSAECTVCAAAKGGTVPKLFFRQRLHERSFICNYIAFDAVTPSVYTMPVETWSI